MKYQVQEITNDRHYWIVVDEQGVQRGEDYLHPLHAQWAAEDLTNGKKLPSELTDEEAFDIAFGITGEIEEAHEQGRVVEHEPIIETVREDRDCVTISEKHEAGEIIEYRGEKWLVTENFYNTGEDTHSEDEDLAPGWYSQLFRVRDKIEVAQVISEQYRDGQARFTGPYTVKFSDEPLPVDNMRTLKYSKELGLHQ